MDITRDIDSLTHFKRNSSEVFVEPTLAVFSQSTLAGWRTRTTQLEKSGCHDIIQASWSK